MSDTITQFMSDVQHNYGIGEFVILPEIRWLDDQHREAGTLSNKCKKSSLDLDWTENQRAGCTITLLPVAHDIADAWWLDLPGIKNNTLPPSERGEK